VLDGLIKERLLVERGSLVYHQQAEAATLYVIRSGSLKTQFEDAHGRMQITRFLLPTEVAGVEGCVGAHYHTHAVALEDSELCVVPVHDVERTSLSVPALRGQFLALINQRLACTQQMLVMLGMLRAEQRMAFFLLDWSQRLGALGADPQHLILRMSRDDIANHLGLKLETVSRLLSRFVRENLIRIHGHRKVQLLDLPMLHELHDGAGQKPIAAPVITSEPEAAPDSDA